MTDVRASVVVQQLSQSRATLQGELAQRSSTLLPNHPAIKAQRAQIREIEEQIAQEGRRVADALEAEASVEQNVENSLRNDLTRLKLSASNATRDNVALESLQREAKAQRDLLESYLLRYSDAISRTASSSALPDVRVVTVAAPSVEPASPKTTLILGAVGFVALVLQIGGILFGELMSGRAVIERQVYRQIDPYEYEEGGPIEAASAEVVVDTEAAELADTEEEATDRIAAEPPEQLFGPIEASAAAMAEELPLPIEPAAEPADAFEEPDLDKLAADLVSRKVQVVMLAALGGFRDCLAVSDPLVAECLRNDLSVVCVDAGSGHITNEAGLTDLSADQASFGDVVHQVGAGLAEVPWGSFTALERRSMKPATLLAALTDVYDVVIVATARIGMASALPIFAGVDCRLVLVGDSLRDRAMFDVAREDAAALGYEVGHQMFSVPQIRSKVA